MSLATQNEFVRKRDRLLGWLSGQAPHGACCFVTCSQTKGGCSPAWKPELTAQENKVQFTLTRFLSAEFFCLLYERFSPVSQGESAQNQFEAL